MRNKLRNADNTAATPLQRPYVLMVGVKEMLPNEVDKDDPNDLDLCAYQSHPAQTHASAIGDQEEEPEPRKIETSEYFQANVPAAADSPAKVKK
jgi:hypothetical protein